MVWDKYIGKEKGIGKCYSCSENIDSKNFEAGHIIPEAKGGPTNIDNLRPICSCCNKSMGTQNMDEFKETYMKSRQIKQKKHETYKFDRGIYVDDRILINEIFSMSNRYQQEY